MTTAATTFTNKNRFGKYHINADSNVIIATYTGAFNKDIGLRYLQHIKQIADLKRPHPWALSANFVNYQALTPDAEKVLLEAYKVGIENNCIADAYCIDSIVGLAQIKKVRQDAGITFPIEKCLFIDEPSATAHLQKFLAKKALATD